MKKFAFTVLALVSMSASALDRRILVNNLSSSAIAEIHATNAGTDSWGPDILGRDILFPGESEYMNLESIAHGYCMFDFKFITESGTITRFGVNVCKISNYNIYD